MRIPGGDVKKWPRAAGNDGEWKGQQHTLIDIKQFRQAKQEHMHKFTYDVVRNQGIKAYS